MTTIHDFEQRTETTDESLKDVAAQKAKALRADGQKALEHGSEHAVKAHGDFEAIVRRNPTYAVLGAAGLGLLAGLMMRGR